MTIFFLIVSLIANVVLAFLCYRAIQTVKIYEDFCETVLRRLAEILTDIRAVDIRGSFEADDEVGIVYKAISGLIQTLAEFLLQNEDSNGS